MTAAPDHEDRRHTLDHATGRPRLLSRKCDTCIFKPGNLMQLAPGRREQMIAEACANDSAIICHVTLNQPQQAVCRGFWDLYRNDTFPLRLAAAFPDRYGPVEVDPPDKE